MGCNEKRSGSRYVLKVELAGFADGLSTGYGEKQVKDDSQVLWPV